MRTDERYDYNRLIATYLGLYGLKVSEVSFDTKILMAALACRFASLIYSLEK